MTQIQPDFDHLDSSSDSVTFSDLVAANDDSLYAAKDALDKLRRTDTSKMTASQREEHQKEVQGMEEVVSVLEEIKEREGQIQEMLLISSEEELLSTFSDSPDRASFDEGLYAVQDALDKLRRTDTSKMTASQRKKHQKEVEEMEEVLSVLSEVSFEEVRVMERLIQKTPPTSSRKEEFLSTFPASPNRAYLWFSRLFPLPFIFLGALLFWFGGIDLENARNSVKWPTTSGQIVSSSVDSSSRKGGGKDYWAELQYEYSVNGNKLQGDRLSYRGDDKGASSTAEAVVSRYPAGKTVSVYYKPENPRVSVLEPGTTLKAWFVPSIGLLFFTAGCGAAIALRKQISS